MLLTTARVLAKLYTCLHMRIHTLAGCVRRHLKLRIGNLAKDLMRVVNRLQCISHGGVFGETAWCHAKHWDQHLRVGAQVLHFTRAVSVRSVRATVPRKPRVAHSTIDQRGASS